MARTWTPKLAVGVPAIDQQHQELFERADALLAAMRGGQGLEEVKRLVGYLDQYVVTHFGAEERLMRARGYPGLAAHLVQHEDFRRQFAAAAAALQQGASTAAVLRVNELIGSWLVKHIGTVDAQLAAFLGGSRVEL